MNDLVTIEVISKALSQFLNKQTYTNIAILVDENTEKYCLSRLKLVENYSVIKIQSGEVHKTLTTCEKIWQAMTDLHLDRTSLLINLGGGVISDMGGFCATTYKRGIDFINIPTTLLSMVDASVGGKLGINFGHLKNHIGLFQSPQTVLIDPIFLDTLGRREIRSGYAEVIKHALINSRSDWKTLQACPLNSSSLHWKLVIQRALEIKSDVVTQDWKEQGRRKILNFGHTIGHAIESYFLNNSQTSVLHGEAVAIGMICELYLSVHNKGFPLEDLKIIEKHLLDIYRKISINKKDHAAIAQLATHDKKNKKETIRAVLLKKIGTPIIDAVISTEDIVKALKYYESLNV